MSNVPAEVAELLRRHDRILVAAHANPDGDAVGACVALGWALRELDKNVLLYNATGFPEYLSWLRLPSPLLASLDRLPAPPDLVVALDCGEAKRLGSDLSSLLNSVPSINIDHHPGNPAYGSLYNWVDPGMSSTGEMVGMVAGALGVPLTGVLAESLYVALVSDTGSFAYDSTTPGSLRLAASLTEQGLNVSAVRARLDNSWSEPKLRLWGRLMQEARLLEDGRLAAGLVSRALLDELGAAREDCEGFVEQLRRVSSVRVAVMLREAEPDADGRACTRVSLRSSGADDVRAVAAQFGGGGHKNAAGATLPLDMERALTVMLPYIRHVWSRDDMRAGRIPPCPSAAPRVV
ncbi:MAG: bifunctional oligoribonuclease/PAP phosphatase NrnA [Desulfovibrionaceae bacterium]|nr:bifunctional oligoribonuclease/PAP phosphatase NrnA [Desulfovibrionaceae bacterium]